LIRTVHLRDGVARLQHRRDFAIRFHPAQEEEETRLKATGFFRALRESGPPSAAGSEAIPTRRGPEASTRR